MRPGGRKPVRSLTGSVVAVTGGARGIGRATAAALVRKGARAAIGDLDLELARRTAGELGGAAAAFPLNVADRDSFAAFLDRVEAEVGPVDALVNNAGIMPVGRFVEEDDATAVRQVAVNLHGVIFGAKLALPRMLARGRGHVVNVASAAGKLGTPGIATYSATKHAVVGLSEALRGELRGTSVEMSVVIPAIVDTELEAGVKGLRGLPTVAPESVAEAIVGVLEAPRFDVYVPRSLGPLTRLPAVLPRRVSEAIAAAMRVHRVMLDVDAGERAGYEARAARSGPRGEAERLEPGAAASADPAAGEPAGERRETVT